MKTLIAVDVGNTSIHLARHTSTGWTIRRRVPTNNFRRVLAAMKSMLSKRGETCVVIGAVVPKIGRFLKKAIANKWGVETHLIGSPISVPIANRYKNPRQVGVDRLLNGLAAYKKFKKPLIVVDFGTAITFDIVSAKGEYLGGVIAPGIEISLDALFQKTALLPKIRLTHPTSIIGKDTVESIRAGCSFGIGGLCDRIIEEIEKERHFKASVIATGGYAKFMSKYCRRIKAVEPDLTLDGIYLTYQHHTRQGS